MIIIEPLRLNNLSGCALPISQYRTSAFNGVTSIKIRIGIRIKIYYNNENENIFL